MRMKKQAISMLLAISMIASLVCVPGFAEDAAGSDNHGHVISDVQGEGQVVETPDGYVGGSEGETGPEDPITSPVNSGDDIYNDIPEEQIMTEDYVSCIHGKTMGETCELCGELAHSSKNIPLIGYDQEFFDQVNPDEDEGWLLYTIRLVCPHGTADGLYCEKCGHVVDNDPADLPMCTILDCCLHGHVKGEKCEECQVLKEDQGDYELAEGEAWDDPLIYATDLMAFDSNVAEMNGNGMLHCSWCGYALGDGINVACHVNSSGKYHWCKIARVEASGTCESHNVVWVYQCGTRITTNNSPYPCHHIGECTWGSYKNWHSDTLATATCQNEGKVQKYYTSTCIHCDATSPALGITTETVPKLDHIITDTEYKDSKLHQISCAGNGTGAHTFTEEHNFVQNGEDYNCSDCDAVKTTVHVDAYTTDGELVKENLVTDIVEVGHNGPESVSVQGYLDKTAKAAVSSHLYPAEEQLDVAVVQAGGIRLKYIVVYDTTAPTITATTTNDTVAITVYDDLSGIKSVSYFGRTINIADQLQHVGEANKKELYFDIRNVESGSYQITAIDHAGNSKTIEVAVDKEAEVPVEFSLYIPSVITFTVDKDGNVTMDPEDPKLYNGVVEKPICITGIKVKANNDWTLADFGTEFTDDDRDSKRIALSVNGTPVSADGSVAIDKAAWVIPADGLISLDLDIKAPKQSSVKTLTNVFTIAFTADWYDESTDPGLTGEISLSPNPIEIEIGKTAFVEANYSDFLSIKSIEIKNKEIASVARSLQDDDILKDYFSEPNIKSMSFKFVYKHNGGYVNYSIPGLSDTVTFAQLVQRINSYLSAEGLTASIDSTGGFAITDADGNYIDCYAIAGVDNIASRLDFVTEGKRKICVNGIQVGETTLIVTMSNGEKAECPVIIKGTRTLKWSYATIPNGKWIDIAYGKGKTGQDLIVIISRDRRSIVSQDGGTTWYESTISTNSAIDMYSVAYGNGVFVAIGSGAWYSRDGINWAISSLPSSTSTSSYTWGYGKHTIAYGAGKFVITDMHGLAVAYSYNGSSWSVARISGSTPSRATPVVYGEAGFIGISKLNDSSILLKSNSGTSWTSTNLGKLTNSYWVDIAYGNKMYLGLIESGYVSKIEDGKDVTTKSIPGSGYKGITFGDGVFVAIKDGSDNCVYSADGETWGRSVMPFSDNWSSIAYCGDKFVVTANASNTIAIGTLGW